MSSILGKIATSGEFIMAKKSIVRVIGLTVNAVLMEHLFRYDLICRGLFMDSDVVYAIPIKYSCKKSSIVSAFNLSRDTVLRAEKTLIDIGILNDISRSTMFGRPNEYTLNMQNLLDFIEHPAEYYELYQNADLGSTQNASTATQNQASYNIDNKENTTYLNKPSVYVDETKDSGTSKERRKALHVDPKKPPLTLLQKRRMLLPETIELIEYWNSKGNLRTHSLHKSPRGHYRHCEQFKYIQRLDDMLPKIMNGTFYTALADMDQINLKNFCFKMSHFKIAIDRYSTSATIEYSKYPEKVANVCIHEFFYRSSSFVYTTKKGEAPSKYRFTFKYPFINYSLNEPVRLSERERHEVKTSYPITVQNVISMLKGHNGYTESHRAHNQVVRQVEKAVTNIRAVANGSSDRIISMLPDVLSKVMAPHIHVDNLYSAVEFKLFPYLESIREIHI